VSGLSAKWEGGELLCAPSLKPRREGVQGEGGKEESTTRGSYRLGTPTAAWKEERKEKRPIKKGEIFTTVKTIQEDDMASVRRCRKKRNKRGGEGLKKRRGKGRTRRFPRVLTPPTHVEEKKGKKIKGKGEEKRYHPPVDVNVSNHA